MKSNISLKVVSAMMNKSLIIFSSLLFFSCNNFKIENKSEVKLKENPIQIDTKEYSTIKDTFRLSDVQSADVLIGSLTPKYPIAYGLTNTYSDVVLFRHGCLSPYGYCIVFKDSIGYKIIRDKKDLKKYFAPISTPEEAISYAYAATGLKPMYSFDIKPNYRVFTKTFKTTRSIETNDGYEVNLFDYILCGCGPHTHLMITFVVKKDGEMYLKEMTKLYEDPSEDGLCVD